MKPASKKFRVQGIIVFVAVTGLIAAFFILFLDGIIKSTIEDQGSRMMKSQIDVGSLSTSLLSHAVDIGNLQVANADKLDENLVQIGRIKFDFDGGRALSKKVIIDDMRLEGLLLNQKRKVPAKPYQRPRQEPEPEEKPEDDSSSSFDMPLAFEFKNPKDILKNEKLETLEVIKKTKEDLKALEDKWKAEFDKNFSKKSLAQIKQRMKNVKAKSRKLKSLEAIQSFAEEIEALDKEIQARLESIHKFQRDLEADIKMAENLINHIASLPEKDFNRLKKKYSLDLKGGTGLISKMVSGPLKNKIDKAWGYYKQISPYLKGSSESKPEPVKIERSKGQFIKFPSADPFPDFLIKHAKLSMNVWEQDVKGSLQGLTSDPKKYGKPFTLDFAGDQNEAFKKFKMKLMLDRTKREASDFLETHIDSLKIKPLPLGKWATLAQGFADINGKIDIQNEQNLKGNFTVKVHGASFTQTDGSANEVSRIVGKVLKSANRFYIKAAIRGTPDNFSLDIKTDLDQILSKSIEKVFNQKIKKFEGDLHKLIESKTAKPLAEANKSVAKLLKLDKNLKTEEATSNDLLSQTDDKAIQEDVPDLDSLLKKLLPF